jgi:serine/threonine-protein phosphatase 2A regulatory subunit B
LSFQSKKSNPRRGEYNVYSTFQSHEPEFDYLKSLEIEEKINKIRWLKRKNPAHFLLSTNGECTYRGKFFEPFTIVNAA